MPPALALKMIAVLCGCLLAGLQAPPAQAPEDRRPPMPYEDVGACPFEGCVYREWTANDVVEVRRDRRADSPVIFTLKKGKRVTALTGVVITVRPARVQFTYPISLDSASGPIPIKAGQSLYLLTYQGEGYTKAWFEGRFYKDVDATDFLDERCADEARQCPGKIVEQRETVWWIRIRNARGEIGWTNEPDKFDGKDALGD